MLKNISIIADMINMIIATTSKAKTECPRKNFPFRVVIRPC